MDGGIEGRMFFKRGCAFILQVRQSPWRRPLTSWTCCVSTVTESRCRTEDLSRRTQ